MDRETGIRLWRVGNVLSCVGVVQFLALTALAMCCNFLSDLGRLTSWSGTANWAAMLLFNGSLALLAISLLPFFWFLRLHAPDRAGLLRIAAGLGFVSTLALIGIGLTPYDLVNRQHNTVLAVWLTTSLVAVSLHAVALANSRETPQWYALFSMLVAVLLAAYACLAFSALGLRPTRLDHGPPEPGQGNPVTHGLVRFIFGGSNISQAATAQKYVVLADLAWFFVFSWRTARSEALRPDERSLDLQQAAEDYLRRMTGQAEEDDKPAKK
jgi:hypothetical protein